MIDKTHFEQLLEANRDYTTRNLPEWVRSGCGAPQCSNSEEVMLIDPKIIEDRLKIIIGAKATRIYRINDMVVLALGPLIEWENDKGEIDLFSSYFIYAKCLWRILSSKGIVVGFRDFFHPAEEMTWEEYDNWDWDGDGNNKFDVSSGELTKQFQETEIVVERIRADKYIGFSLFLSNDFELQVIPDHSKQRDLWGFIDNTENGRSFDFCEEFEESDWQ